MNIKNFQSALTQGGVRTNLFIVEGKIGANTSNKTRFLVKAAALPPSTLGTIAIPYRGRQVKIPGDRTFDTWTLSVLMDGDYELRNKFEAWQQLINGNEDNVPDVSGGFFTSAGSGFNTDVFCEWKISSLNRQGNAIKTYSMVGAFPTDISSVELSNDSTDTIGEFTVTMQYQYWLASSGQGSAGDKTPVTRSTTNTDPENAL
tara:strand:+ start:34 stop:642 length:609 start_codon:yes stop_codon:yes gene_type:complete